MTSQRATGSFLFAAVFSIVMVDPAAASLPSAATACSISKAKAASSAFGCYLKQHVRSASGRSADPAACTERLTRRFTSVESRGSCPTAGDAAFAASRAEAAATQVMDAIGVAMVTSDEELLCLGKKAKLAARYATCQSTALLKRLTDSQRTDYDFSLCRIDHAAASVELDAALPCPAAGESALVQEHSGLGYGFLPATVWNSQAMSGAPLPHAYLAGAEFGPMELEAADFRGADLTNSTFENATVGRNAGPDFSGANFAGATLTDTYFDLAVLDGAEFATATLDGFRAIDVASCPASLPPDWGCYGNHVVGPTSFLWFVSMAGTDLTGANLSHVSMYQTYLNSTVLRDVDLSHAFVWYSYFSGADMLGADLSMATFYNDVGGSNLVECPASLPAEWNCINRNLLGPNALVFAPCTLAGTDLSGLNLSSSYFHGCDLSGANLASANASYTSFHGCDFTGANFGSANISQSTMSQSDLTGADFTNANASLISWSNGTICPDGVEGNCCYHYLPGQAPAVCGN